MSHFLHFAEGAVAQLAHDLPGELGIDVGLDAAQDDRLFVFLRSRAGDGAVGAGAQVEHLLEVGEEGHLERLQVDSRRILSEIIYLIRNFYL